MSIIPVYRGEFGLKVMWHAPRIYARGAGHTIEIEAGDEALYPLAREWRVVPRVPDAQRTQPPRIAGPVQLFQPQPHVAQAVGAVDVVIAPRKRAYAASKNWPHWARVVQALEHAGLRVFAGGVEDASDTTVTCDAAWYYPRPLDATLSAMHTARLVIGGCGGLPALAMLVGTPLLLFTYQGMVAPGPVINSRGQFVSTEYWPVRLQEYYHANNHRGVPITVVNGWEYPQFVVSKALEILRAPKAGRRDCK